uniref:Putative secreted protein n=1 Tax=Panstrongylus lignarius TaxID=156445 RepID=A0A224Y1S5_9HEMI
MAFLLVFHLVIHMTLADLLVQNQNENAQVCCRVLKNGPICDLVMSAAPQRKARFLHLLHQLDHSISPTGCQVGSKLHQQSQSLDYQHLVGNLCRQCSVVRQNLRLSSAAGHFQDLYLSVGRR